MNHFHLTTVGLATVIAGILALGILVPIGVRALMRIAPRSSRPPRRGDGRDRGEVNLADVFMTFFLLIAFVVSYPFISDFVAMVTPEADPFSALLLRFTIAAIPIVLIISVGVSARRGGL